MSGQEFEVLLEQLSDGRWRLSQVQSASLHGDRDIALRFAQRMAHGRALTVREPK